jgi:hypothetical protein
MAINLREQVVFSDPRTFEERAAIAESCVRKLGIRIPAVVDEVSDGVEATYTGWPDRLYVIDRAGKIAFKSPPGPYGFVPERMEEALRKSLAQ